MSDDKLPLSFSPETLAEVKALLRGADDGAPLTERLRNPKTPYSPALLRKEAADRIEALEAALAKADELARAIDRGLPKLEQFPAIYGAAETYCAARKGTDT